MKHFRILALALACLCARTSFGAQPVALSLSLPDGRLAVSSVIDPRGRWVRTGDGRIVRTEAAGDFDGGLEVRDADGSIEITARQTVPWGDEVMEWRLNQGRECVFSVILRSPVGEAVANASPVVQELYREKDLTRLVLRHPEVRSRVDALLGAAEPGRRWEPGEFALAQARAGYEPPPGVADGVAGAVADLDSSDWKKREAAAEALAEPRFALYALLRLDRSALTAEQRRGVEVALSGLPVLTESDRESLRQLIR